MATTVNSAYAREIREKALTLATQIADRGTDDLFEVLGLAHTIAHYLEDNTEPCGRYNLHTCPYLHPGLR